MTLAHIRPPHDMAEAMAAVTDPDAHPVFKADAWCFLKEARSQTITDECWFRLFPIPEPVRLPVMVSDGRRADLPVTRDQPLNAIDAARIGALGVTRAAIRRFFGQHDGRHDPQGAA